MNAIKYSTREKLNFLEEFKNSNLSIEEYAEQRAIPETTLKKWLKEERELAFGAINVNPSKPYIPKNIDGPMVFVCENIRIELKENFNKEFLKKIVEVLIND